MWGLCMRGVSRNCVAMREASVVGVRHKQQRNQIYMGNVCFLLRKRTNHNFCAMHTFGCIMKPAPGWYRMRWWLIEPKWWENRLISINILDEMKWRRKKRIHVIVMICVGVRKRNKEPNALAHHPNLSLAYELFKRVRAYLTIKRIFRTRLITIFGYFREGVCAWRRCAKAHEVRANALAH